MSKYNYDKMQQMYNSGMSCIGVANDIGCDPSTVSRNIETDIKDYNKEEIKRLYNSGISCSQVASEIGCSRVTVFRVVDTRSISESLEGRDIEWTDDISESLEGHKVSDETRRKISEANKGKDAWCRGMTKQSHPDKITWGVSGEDHHNWKGGISSEHKKIRESQEYKNWRESVFERDGHTCQDCGETNIELHGHHIKPFAEFENERFNTDNGVTLCRECHMNLHYGDNNE